MMARKESSIEEEESGGGGPGSVENRPGVLLVGSPNVGKRTLLSSNIYSYAAGLLSVDIPDTDDLAGGVLCQGWTIETKYYSADISIWISHLVEDFSLRRLPNSEQLAALVMVFDMNDESSLLALKSWFGSFDLDKFEILLCIGNKVDLVPGHNSHANYRRFLQRQGESSSDPHPEFWDYGIDETEGFSLLGGGEEPSSEIRNSCLEWCMQHNIEFIEACASNPDFDKCLSVDGDIQGVSRLYGALSAHMWPGMVMKSGERVTPHLPVEKEDITDGESDYEIEYEVLSGGSDDPWEYVSSSELPSTSKKAGIADEQVTIRNNQDLEHEKSDVNKKVDLSTSKASAGASSPHSNDISSEMNKQELDYGSETIKKSDQTCNGNIVAEQSTSEVEAQEVGGNTVENIESDQDAQYGHEELERLMCEIGSMRDSLRLMPDFQRRDMAAKLAMKMASVFGYSSDEDGTLE